MDMKWLGTDVRWLRGRGVYEVCSSGVDLAPYRSNLVSLPASLDGSPKLTDLLPPEVRDFLDGEHELTRRTREETNALVEDGGVLKLYMDSVLRHNKKRYLTFLRQLLSRGMLNFVERTEGLRWSLFCVEVVEDKATVYHGRETGKHVFHRCFRRWSCALQRLFPGSRLNVTISGPFDEQPVRPGLSQPCGAGYGRRVWLFPSA